VQVLSKQILKIKYSVMRELTIIINKFFYTFLYGKYNDSVMKKIVIVKFIEQVNRRESRSSRVIKYQLRRSVKSVSTDSRYWKWKYRTHQAAARIGNWSEGKYRGVETTRCLSWKSCTTLP